MAIHTVRFIPDDVSVKVERGTDLLRAAILAGVPLRSGCGGAGTCGRCAVLIREGRVTSSGGNLPERLREPGHVLACATFVESDLIVEVPESSRLSEHRVLLEKMSRKEVLAEKESDGLERYALSPICVRVPFKMEPPTLTDCASDLVRLRANLRRVGFEGIEVSPSLLKHLPHVARQRDWEVTASISRAGPGLEVFDLEAGHVDAPAIGLCVDIGTTTVVTHLVNMDTGAVLDSRGTYNRQAPYGDDVITRIIHASENPQGLGELQGACVNTINDLLKKALGRRGLAPQDIRAAIIAGNTTMTHLFLGIPPKYIRLEPYVPVASDFPPVKADAVGIGIHPASPVWCMPAVASYVGGDIVSGVLASGMTRRDEVSLFIDIGTNGEIVLGNRDWLVSCACSAGPCFEGSGISSGMRAMPGAIEAMEIDPDTLECSLSTVGGSSPKGICGSGLVDALAEMRKAGIIDRSGQFAMDRCHPRLRERDEGPEFLVVPAGNGCDRDIAITEGDVKNLLRAKGAVYAGIRSLLRAVDLSFDVISRIYIAGGFGNYLNVRESIEIGLLPDVDPGVYVFIGNSSIKGARLALMSREAMEEARELARKMTYLELSVGTTFMDEYVSAMFLPHTDLRLFPSVSDDR